MKQEEDEGRKKKMEILDYLEEIKNQLRLLLLLLGQSLEH